MWHGFEDMCEGDASLDPRQFGADAKMQAVAKAQMTIWRAVDAKAIRIVEDLGVAIGGTEHELDAVAGADPFAAQGHIFRR